MAEKKEKIFANGMRVMAPRENAPDWVKGSLGIEVDSFKKFLDDNVNAKGWVNIDLLLSQKGTWYASLNTYKPKTDETEIPF